ncbi:MAG TPA: FecR family protein, partial [Polyangiales bacterium]|nr:FecR family protein [Polyangiales bacterium]
RAAAWTWAFAATFVLIAAGAWFWLRQTSPGPLHAQGKADLPSVLTGAAQTAPLELSDGSHVALATGARLEVLRNDGRSFVTVLRRGESTFDIRPGGPRRWVIETGLASVEVLGTRFRVTRAEDAVTVAVERGVVLVRGETVPAGAVQLRAGEQLSVQDRESPKRIAVPATPSAPAPIVSAAPPLFSEPRAPKLTSAKSVENQVDQLLSSADAARRAGNTALAISELQRVLALTSDGDPRRGLAALSLARLTLERDPALAAEALERARSSMPRELSEDAQARQVEALVRAGRRAEARQLGSDYLQRYPQGRRTEDVKRWLKDAGPR